jgi:hypothetical protein
MPCLSTTGGRQSESTASDRCDQSACRSWSWCSSPIRESQPTCSPCLSSTPFLREVGSRRLSTPGSDGIGYRFAKQVTGIHAVRYCRGPHFQRCGKPRTIADYDGFLLFSPPNSSREPKRWLNSI